MTRRETKVQSEVATRYRIVIDDDPHPPTGNRQLAFLRQLSLDGIDQGFLTCGPVPFQSLSIDHDGQRWVATLEATEQKLVAV